MTALMRYLLKKSALLLPVFLGVSIMAFALGVMSPGDPVDQMLNPNGNESYSQEEYEEAAARMGLDKPICVQYANWLNQLLHGDLGRSFFTNKSIMEQLSRRIPISARLAALSMIFTILFGVGFGVWMAVYKDRMPDHILSLCSTTALSVPSFWIAIILIYWFAERWKLLPTSGITSPAGYLLPSITLALPSIGVCARLTRSSILDEIGRQYVTVALSKGLSRRQVVMCHAFANALIPVVTYLGTHMAGILGGASVVETVFAIPGVGSYAILAVQSRDYYVVQAYVLFSGAVYVVVNVLTDLFYMAVDPRIRSGGMFK